MNGNGHYGESQARYEDLWFLPEVLEVAAALAHYATPKEFVIGTEVVQVHEAVEIQVKTAAPFPVRALSPVLYVGDTVLTKLKQTGENQYRFYGLEPNRLREGAPIAIGWYKLPTTRVSTRFRFRLRDAPNVA